MTAKDLEDLYDYGYWANARLLEVVSQLTPDEFTRNVAGSYGSIRNTMVHMLSAEWGWLSRCGGHKRPGRLDPDDYPTAQALIDTWTEVEVHVRAFLSGLQDDDVARYVEFTLGEKWASMTLGALMQHGAMHGVHHRGQVALLLRLLGHTPGNVDVLFYHAEKGRTP